MTDPFNRGGSPGRAREALQRSGSFKPGHKKRGGRKKGSRNVISPEHKRALFEAANRVGSDGNGTDGMVGYFGWVAKRDLTFFYVELWGRLLELQIHEEAMGAGTPGTTNEPGDGKLMTFQLRDGPDEEVRELMSLAIKRPKQFCKALCAALLTPPKGWRARARRKGLCDDGEPAKTAPRPYTREN